MNRRQRRLCIVALRRGHLTKRDVLPAMFEHRSRDYYARRQKIRYARVTLRELEEKGFLDKTETGWRPTEKLKKEMEAILC